MRKLAWPVLALAATTPLLSGYREEKVGFEYAVRLSDTIVVGRVIGPAVTRSFKQEGVDKTLPLATRVEGRVFTPYKVEVNAGNRSEPDGCVFDKNGNCPVGEITVYVPGGIIQGADEDGNPRWESITVRGSAGYALPESGKEALLFLTRRGDGFQRVRAAGTQIPVDRTTGTPKVPVRFDSWNSLTPEGKRQQGNLTLRDSYRRKPAGEETPRTTARIPKRFQEDVTLDRVRELVEQLRLEARSPKRGP